MKIIYFLLSLEKRSLKMVNVDIDKSLYENITKIVNENKLDFPSIRHFVNKMLFEKVKENNFKK